MPDLSVIIPARNEEFLQHTIDNLLGNIRGRTELIVVLDGYWPDEGIPVDPRVTVIHHQESIGQRAAVNEAARLSQAKYLMKLDAHCTVDEGFDIKLAADCEYDWTVIPAMYNLHAYDWQCGGCGHRTYHGPKPTRCESEKCPNTTDFHKAIVFEPRLKRRTEFACFDKELHFQYWREYKKRPEAQGDIVDVMSSVGACFFMHRERFWELGGMDEAHGSWGQFGVEVACKAWLSGGRHVVNKKTWFSHLFRTQKGFGFPYAISGNQVERARKHSRHLWQGDKWDKATRKFQWILDKFAPIPDWHEEALTPQQRTTTDKPVSNRAVNSQNLTKGLVYYTDNQCEERITNVVRQNLASIANGFPIVSVSQYPIDFGRQNIVLPEPRGDLTMFKQILAGLEAIDTDVVFLVEHDVIYHPSHFEFTPARADVFYYNQNTWKVDAKTGRALFYHTKQVSGLCAYRELLLEHYRKRVKRVEEEGFSRRMGFEPGSHRRKERIDDYAAEAWMSEHPNLDLRHASNRTANRWSKSQFRNQPVGWQMADRVPFWGITKGRFDEVLREILETTDHAVQASRTRAGEPDDPAAVQGTPHDLPNIEGGLLPDERPGDPAEVAVGHGHGQVDAREAQTI